LLDRIVPSMVRMTGNASDGHGRDPVGPVRDSGTPGGLPGARGVAGAASEVLDGCELWYAADRPVVSATEESMREGNGHRDYAPKVTPDYSAKS